MVTRAGECRRLHVYEEKMERGKKRNWINEVLEQVYK